MRTVLSNPGRTLPGGSCVNTTTAQRPLSNDARDNGVIIYGNNTSERYTQAMMLAEDALIRDEHVIVFDYGRFAFGLNTKRGKNKRVASNRQLVRASTRPSSYGPLVLKQDGRIHARIATGHIPPSTPCNVIYDLDDFDYDETTMFLADYFSEIIKGPTTGITFVLPALDAMIARRRHGSDSNALRHLLSIILRGRAKGHRFILAAFSPDEIPNEYRNNIGTPIIGWSTGTQQIRAIDKVVMKPIIQYHDILGRGVMMMPRDIFWSFSSIDARPDYIHAMPDLTLVTDAGGGQDVEYDQTDDETAYGEIYDEIKAEEDVEPIAAKAKTNARAKSKARQSYSPAIRLGRLGKVYYCQLSAAATAALRVEQGGSFTSRKRNTSDEVIDFVLANPQIETVNNWLCRNRNAWANIASFTVIAAAAFQMAKQNENQTIAFLNGLANPTDGRRNAGARALVAQLGADTSPLDSQKRYDALLAAWTESRTTTCDNDNITLKQAA